MHQLVLTMTLNRSSVETWDGLQPPDMSGGIPLDSAVGQFDIRQVLLPSGPQEGRTNLSIGVWGLK